MQNLSIEFPEQSITIILGKSGCGKTTLLRILAGFEECTSGEVITPAKEKIGMVFQEPRLMPWLTVWKNITFGVPKGRLNIADVERLIELTGLNGFESAYPSQLSGGMQQRAALARALAYDPELILMDEPFAALDHFTRESMQKELINIFLKQKKSILFVTHSVDEALLIGQKILVLNPSGVAQEFDLSQYTYPRDLLSQNSIVKKKEILEAIQTKKEQMQ
ncbi:ABC transporter ATP-binding protein [Clostridium merdae]|uniref:ABC transporter ATP-binding protein n=1 Tax=Clostridium merdae TaxID=1958780 RepID=UPI003119296C